MIKRVLAILLVCLAILPTAAGEPLFTITFLDVGQGDCAILTCGGETMLVDTGTIDAWRHIEESFEAGTNIDYLVLTHPHLDHIANAERIIERNTVESVILPPIEHSTKTYERTMDAIARNGIECVYPEVGDVFSIGKATATVYAPHPVAYAEENDWSIVLMVEYAGRKILLEADAEAASEMDMLSNNDVLPLKADVLNVAHHGSDTSSLWSFISAVSPKYAVVSCNSSEEREYPSVETAMTLYECGIEDVLTTEVYGDITIEISSDGQMTISTSKGG